MVVAVVVGASRGIGLAIATRLKADGHTVYATCRSDSPALEQLQDAAPDFHVVSDVDVGHDGGCEGLPAGVRADAVDLLVVNAGVYAADPPAAEGGAGSADFGAHREQFEVNALGPLRVVAALRGGGKLRSGAKILVIGSQLGSVALTTGGRYGYRMSKAAAHIAAASLAADLKSSEVAVGIVHPGVVATDMTKISGSPTTLTADESAKGILERAAELNMGNTGRFWDYRGNALPW